MKILFACSCLEPGMDGVGDYTRKLAAELAARGHECHLLALADSHVTETTVGELREAGLALPALRLPANLPWPDRVRRAREWSERVSPDWISWQIVPYGYDPRGLTFGLGGRLRAISSGFKTQVMFHEIWIGEARQAPFKHKVVGKLQRRIIHNLLRELRPQVIHTHTPLYQYLLTALGHRVAILPLFGNVPLASAVDSDWLQKKWPEGGAKFLAQRAGGWIFTIFGSIHPEWDEDDFRRRATATAQRAGKKCLLIGIGRPGVVGEQKLKRLAENQDDVWQVANLGQQSEADISQCLLATDFGVSALPAESIFKSGTMAAMVEHGLHVVVTRPVSDYPSCPPETTIAGLRNVVTDFNFTGLEKTKRGSLLPGIATQFIEDLQRA